MRWLLVLFFLGAGWYYTFKPDLTWRGIHRQLDRHQGEPWTARTEYYLGMFKYLRGEYPQAMECFQKIMDNQATSYYGSSAYFRMAQCLEETGNVAKSAELYRKVFDEFPKSSHAKIAHKAWERLPRTNEF